MVSISFLMHMNKKTMASLSVYWHRLIEVYYGGWVTSIRIYYARMFFDVKKRRKKSVNSITDYKLFISGEIDKWDLKLIFKIKSYQIQSEGAALIAFLWKVTLTCTDFIYKQMKKKKNHLYRQHKKQSDHRVVPGRSAAFTKVVTHLRLKS